MKAQLVVVQGKPEGKTIPLAIPQFKIGRGDGCQLRPNHDQVSREHAMFEVTSDSLFLQDLGSRNGTEVNGKKLPAHDPYKLKNGDLVKIGPLTFAVSIEGAPTASVAAPAAPSKKTGSLDDVSYDEIDAWLVSDPSKEPPDRQSGVYGGDTMTIDTFKSKDKPASSPTLPASKTATPIPAAKAPTPAPAPVAKVPTPSPAPAAKAPTPAPAPVKAPEPEPELEPESEPEPEPVEDEIEAYKEDDGIEDLSESTASLEEEMPEEFVDESNPFYVKKKVEPAPTAATKAPQRDSSDAANDILRRMMDRKRASKS